MARLASRWRAFAFRPRRPLCGDGVGDVAMGCLEFHVVINGKERTMWFTSQKDAIRWGEYVLRDDRARSLLMTDENNNIYFDVNKDDAPCAGTA